MKYDLQRETLKAEIVTTKRFEAYAADDLREVMEKANLPGGERKAIANQIEQDRRRGCWGL